MWAEPKARGRTGTSRRRAAPRQAYTAGFSTPLPLHFHLDLPSAAPYRGAITPRRHNTPLTPRPCFQDCTLPIRTAARREGFSHRAGRALGVPAYSNAKGPGSEFHELPLLGGICDEMIGSLPRFAPPDPGAAAKPPEHLASPLCYPPPTLPAGGERPAPIPCRRPRGVRHPRRPEARPRRQPAPVPVPQGSGPSPARRGRSTPH